MMSGSIDPPGKILPTKCVAPPVGTFWKNRNRTGHDREIRAVKGLSEVDSVALVVEKLGQWRVRPGQIHPGEFAVMLRLMDEKLGVPRSGAESRRAG